MRINVRLDPDRAQKVAVLRQRTSLTVSEIVRRALDVYYREVRRKQPRAAEILAATGFIGGARADRDLSESYKERLYESLAANFGER